MTPAEPISAARVVPSWPSVSVIIPTRDRPDFLRRAVDAVVAQQYQGRIECLVVHDGGEPPDPPSPARGGREVRVLKNSRTRGPAGARNTGALAAAGEYLAFCDDDDEWLPHKLRQQVELLRRDADVLVACSGIEIRSGSGTTKRISERETVLVDELIRSRRIDLHTSTIVVSRDAFVDRVGLMDEAIPASYGEDYDWLLRAAQAGRLATVREPLARIAYHAGSYFDRSWRTIIAAEHYLLARHPEFARDAKALARIHGRLAFAHAALGERSAALAWARSAFRLSRSQPRTYLALLVVVGVSSDPLLRLLQRFGRDI